MISFVLNKNTDENVINCIINILNIFNVCLIKLDSNFKNQAQFDSCCWLVEARDVTLCVESHPVEAAQVFDQVFIGGRVVVDDSVLFVHTAGLSQQTTDNI